ncbi:hypothetical protein E2C01_084851 [Portunus trituberculatus]|uniref:Uncharacterized protein n=1 Tax=Portunus trituberculatus TaxID=210409 RepID=A0A5B7JAD4_PORTR|nr:hypothetical protein [Portunus trituberculatus]
MNNKYINQEATLVKRCGVEEDDKLTVLGVCCNLASCTWAIKSCSGVRHYHNHTPSEAATRDKQT